MILTLKINQHEGISLNADLVSNFTHVMSFSVRLSSYSFIMDYT